MRADDSPEFIARRLADFERLTEPVIAVLASAAAATIRVDAGDGTPADIHARLVESLAGEVGIGARTGAPNGAQTLQLGLTDE